MAGALRKPFDVRAEVPFDDAEQAVAIEISPQQMPSAPVDTDFIPNPNAPQVEARPKQSRATERVHLENTEFRTGAEQRKVQKGRNERVLALAKSMYASKKGEIEAFNNAKRFVSKATDKQRKNPATELAEAMSIVAKGHPLTKQQAVARAKREVMQNAHETTDLTLGS